MNLYLTKKTDLIFSINVHENINFLIYQLENIKKYVKSNYIIILNANKIMYNEIKNNRYIKNNNSYIILYPDYLNKKRFHGSLTEGIYRNMQYALDNYNYKYFIVLSSRNIFYTELNPEKYKYFIKNSFKKRLNELSEKWHWPSILRSEISKYIIRNNLYFSKSAHEGVTFDYNACKDILSFLNRNDYIRKNLFEWNSCMEEFALQSICINHSQPYYDIGNGTNTNYNINDLKENTFIYKTIRK